jgi:hypothetical protein
MMMMMMMQSWILMIEKWKYIYGYSYRICATAFSKAFRNPSKWDERLE